MFGQEKPRRSGAKRTRVTLRNECFFGVFGSATIPQGLVPERKAPPDDGEMMTLRTLLEKSSDADLLRADLHEPDRCVLQTNVCCRSLSSVVKRAHARGATAPIRKCWPANVNGWGLLNSPGEGHCNHSMHGHFIPPPHAPLIIFSSVSNRPV